MKKGIIASLLMLLVIGYVYFFEFSTSQENQKKSLQRSQLADSHGVEKIILSLENEDPIVFVQKEGWWIEQPVQYPADPGAMEQNLTVMRQILADSHFLLKEDSFGFSDSQYKIELFYKEGESKELILGSKKAPGNKIYVLNSKEKKVFVVNNVWGQFFYKKLRDYLVKDIHISYLNVKKLAFKSQKEEEWFVEKEGEDWFFSQGQERKKIKSRPIGGLLRPLKQIKIDQILFEKKEVREFYFLTLWFKDGKELRLSLNEEMNLMTLPHLKVVAKVNPSSVRYFFNEIKKAVKNGD